MFTFACSYASVERWVGKFFAGDTPRRYSNRADLKTPVNCCEAEQFRYFFKRHVDRYNLS
jgi:hypothetical protein